MLLKTIYLCMVILYILVEYMLIGMNISAQSQTDHCFTGWFAAHSGSLLKTTGLMPFSLVQYMEDDWFAVHTPVPICPHCQ